MATIKDIAQAVGISTASVSLYLRDSGTTRVSAKTKEKIDQAIRHLKYRPNIIARSLVMNKTNLIGIMLPFQGPFFRSTFVNEVLSGIQSVLFPKNYSMVFVPTNGNDSRSMVKNHLGQSSGYDGYILFGTRYCSAEDMEANAREFLKTDIPFTVINMPEFSIPINQVLCRDPANFSVVQYFLDLGHRNILILVGRANNKETQHSITDYKYRMEKCGAGFNQNKVLYGDFEKDIAKGVLLQYLKKSQNFSAIYCTTDSMALGAYEALRENNLSIPDDVSVIGRNDSFFATIIDPPLTTVKRNSFKEGVRAAELLLSTIETGRSGRKIYLESHLLIRGSVKSFTRE